VTAPIAQAQLAETFVMNQVHLQTVLASKAARVVTAAEGRSVVDFGPRRMHGIDAAIKAARAFHIAGVAATSNTLAGQIYGVPMAGTMAHSFVQAAQNEMEAFRAFTALYPETILLVDTYDTLQGVHRVVALARELGDAFKVRAVRLDSGDLADLATKTRAILDEAGLQRVEIFASGSLDEDAIAEIVARGAPITGFGVGTSMGVSQDAPGLDIAYKLCAYGRRGRVKLSTGKPVLPGRKQVFRIEEGGRAVRDVIARAEEALPGRPLLRPVMRGGRRLPEATTDLHAARRRRSPGCPGTSARSGRPSDDTPSRRAKGSAPTRTRSLGKSPWLTKTRRSAPAEHPDACPRRFVVQRHSCAGTDNPCFGSLG
jgi:nicotinate phosphoribosyltransferase